MPDPLPQPPSARLQVWAARPGFNLVLKPIISTFVSEICVKMFHAPHFPHSERVIRISVTLGTVCSHWKLEGTFSRGDLSGAGGLSLSRAQLCCCLQSILHLFHKERSSILWALSCSWGHARMCALPLRAHLSRRRGNRQQPAAVCTQPGASALRHATQRHSPWSQTEAMARDRPNVRPL